MQQHIQIPNQNIAIPIPIMQNYIQIPNIPNYIQIPNIPQYQNANIQQVTLANYIPRQLYPQPIISPSNYISSQLYPQPIISPANYIPSQLYPQPIILPANLSIANISTVSPTNQNFDKKVRKSMGLSNPKKNCREKLSEKKIVKLLESDESAIYYVNSKSSLDNDESEKYNIMYDKQYFIFRWLNQPTLYTE